MANQLVIKINGDIKGFKDALNQVQSQTVDLEEGLARIATISGVAFAALTAEAGLAIAAFSESQQATRELSLAMQNQGIYSSELAQKYKDQAAALQKLTGVDDDSIIRSQALLQGMIGQTEISKELTTAILDLSAAKKIDLDSATALIGKGIEGHTGALKKLGIEIDAHLSKEERTAQIIELVTQKFGGQAEAANKGLGGIKGLKSAVGDFQEEIGRRLAPAVEFIISKLTIFFQTLAENKPLLDLIFQAGVAAAVFTGMVTGISLAVLGFVKLRAALLAASVATGGMSLAVKGLIGATGIGLLAIIVSDLALNWETRFGQMQAVFAAFSNNIGSLGSGLANILKGIFTLDKERITQGLAEVKNAFTKGFNDFQVSAAESQAKIAAAENAGVEKQIKSKKDAADKQNAIDREQAAFKAEMIAAENEAMVMQLQQASDAAIELKKEEIDLLSKLQDEKFEENKELLIARLEEVRELEAEQFEIDQEQKAEFEAQVLANNEVYNQMSSEQQAIFRQKEAANLQAQMETKKTIEMTAAKIRAEEQIKSNNQFLLEQQKFGTAYASINQLMHSEIYKGSKTAFSELSALTASENSKLKAIGKAAAIATTIIKTAESAMNIYAGFSTIPIIGPALGIAGAAAAVAFGAEQVGKITSAASGGMITGGIPGVDSVPVLAQQGELVSPAQNFEEVIGSVRAMREAENMAGGFGVENQATVLVGFDGREASQVLTIRQIEDRALGISREG